MYARKRTVVLGGKFGIKHVSLENGETYVIPHSGLNQIHGFVVFQFSIYTGIIHIDEL